MSIRDATAMLVGADGLVPKERYVSQEFLDLEMEKLWPRVWQVACREEELPETGDYLEYTIGDQSILVVRTDPGTIKGYFNTCLHRGTRLADGRGNFGEGRDPMPVPRLALCPRRPADGDRRPPRVPGRAVGPRPARGAGRTLGRLRVREHGPRCRAPDRLPRSHSQAARALPPRPDALRRVSDHDPAGQLEGRRRRLQRGLPRAGHPSPAVGLDRRREHGVRPVRHARPLRPARPRPS